MTEFEKRMLALKEREVKALEKQAQAKRDNELRNGPRNHWIPGPGQLGIGGRWAYGTPDRER